MASRVHASSTRSVVAAPQTERRNSRRLIPRRLALRSHSTWARRTVSRMTGESGVGLYSPFEHGPNLMGSPGSSSRQPATGDGWTGPIGGGFRGELLGVVLSAGA